jgi:hypothetical protein
MSSVGLYGFEIPHDFVQPTRDMVIIRMPLPPKKIGSIITPQTSRDCWRSTTSWPAASSPWGRWPSAYKDGDGLKRRRRRWRLGHDPPVRRHAWYRAARSWSPAAGATSPAFQDVIGIIPADKMPDPETLLWDERRSRARPGAGEVAAVGRHRRARAKWSNKK